MATACLSQLTCTCGCCTGWARRPMVSWRTPGAGSRAAPSGARSTWTRQTTRRMASRNWPASMGTMIRGATLPLVATLTFKDEAEQYLVAIVLRPGNSPAKPGAVRASCARCCVAAAVRAF